MEAENVCDRETAHCFLIPGLFCLLRVGLKVWRLLWSLRRSSPAMGLEQFRHSLSAVGLATGRCRDGGS